MERVGKSILRLGNSLCKGPEAGPQDVFEAMKDSQGGLSREKEGCWVVKGWARTHRALLVPLRCLVFTLG